ncbi:MAG: ribosome small subunit-dependent GTPase A [Chloroflexi bacterium]|nr:ribosome small subunit-dependent GTPase A [Chloroflexota bacterium]
MNRTNPYSGIVIKKITNAYLVQSDAGNLTCTLSQRLKQQSTGDPVAIGDKVCWNEAAQIAVVLPRRNQLARRSAVPMPGAHAHEQVIVANVDQIVPVIAAASPRLAWRLLDRYLVSAESAEIPAVVCITKMDLVDSRPESEEIEAVAAEYRAIGYGVILTSMVSGQGMEEIQAVLRGRLSVFVGKSGVGKTSLLNAIEPGLRLRVQETSQATGKGRHTTTHMEMFPLQFGGAIIDTPGIREFGLWDVDQDDLALFFPEMRPFVGVCKFGRSCRHDEEPGCAIRRAVNAGLISPYRYQSYLKLRAQP